MSERRRQAILRSATRIFSRKGFGEAKISEIARGAKLASSGIYTYFKGKEEILFAIIEAFMTTSQKDLIDHLQGIEGSENKLRKAIWFHCKSYSGNRNEIKIILEARSYPRFYQSAAYQALKTYAGLITAIINEGIQDGTFPGLSSPMILRDMILGTIDHIAINWTIRDASNSLDKAELIYDMIIKGAKASGKEELPADKKREKQKRIINSATTLFAEKGFNDTSTLEIARHADVAEGTVFEYFNAKENLLISIPAEKLGQLLSRIQGKELENNIKEIISQIFQFYNDEKTYSTILVLMLRTNKGFHESESNQIIENIFNVIRDLIVQGQKKKIFKKDLDMEICRDLLFGTIDHIIIPWIMFNRNYDLKKIGEEVSDLFINVLKT